MKSNLINLTLFSVILSAVTSKVHYTKLHKNQDVNKGCTVISESDDVIFKGLNGSDENITRVFTKPAVSTPYNDINLSDKSTIVEVFGNSKKGVDAYISTICKVINKVKSPSNSRIALPNNPEVRKIIDGGDAKNRIDVVFMGDGYTAQQKDSFFSDIQRLTKDMFEGVTFKSWLPLFNIWAIHVDSKESGIGYDGPKDTAFQLTRDAGQLRGIFPLKPEYAREVCKLTGDYACDYPSIIGNDDFYGGLGGEFVISTKSARTGTVVLRHEMGHNFVDVGEEYDNGQVYDGVNAAQELQSVGWKHWINGPVREEKAIYRLLAYPWKDLSKGSVSLNFTSDGKYSRWYMLASVTAAAEEDCLEFTLDGKVLPWKTRGSDDREFYEWKDNRGFSAGNHTITIRSKTNSTNKSIPRMIANIVLHEFGTEREFKVSNDNYSAYPTWDINRKKTYRPTNAKCLMRNMTSSSFCNVCKEGMWLQFLKRISLIDSLEYTNKRIYLSTLKLGELRDYSSRIPGESLNISWYYNSKYQFLYHNQYTIPNPKKGNWTVKVEFKTKEIRKDPENHTVDFATIIV
ncbi:hypothetical protein K502DRAFT_368636 [Neoconidiobolus thromboides FSU 785]|nr:hypothetical protein K502DRAFT_368636 [Neoconidiobolus thromboides FSU 785]